MNLQIYKNAIIIPRCDYVVYSEIIDRAASETNCVVNKSDLINVKIHHGDLYMFMVILTIYGDITVK